MISMIQEWVLANFTYYSKVSDQRSPNKDDNWRAYMENSTAPLRKPFHNIGILKNRVLIVCCLLLNVMTVYMIASTYFMLTPQVSWTCINDPHVGVSATCKKYSAMDYYKRAVCYMSPGSEFHWNFTFVQTPILEYGAYCPLARLVEPKMINFVGLLCGSLVGGFFIDSLGRKNVAILCIFFSTLTSLVYKANSSMIMFTYLEFVKGAFTSVAGVALMAWLVEQASPRFCNLVVTLFFCAASLGGLAVTGITRGFMEWKMATLTIACGGLLFLPLALLVPSSLRHKIARGSTKDLPSDIDFTPGLITDSTTKRFLTTPQTNRIYLTNITFLLVAGFSSHLLIELIDLQHGEFELFGKVIVVQLIQCAGFLLAAFFSLLPVFMYVVNVCGVLAAGILALVASSAEFTDDLWSQAKVFTGTSLMLVSLCVALTFTTLKQIPTLNRGFYISGLNAAYILGALLNTVMQSYCLKQEHETQPYCAPDTSTSIRLIACGVLLISSTVLAFINTCLARNTTELPHSFRDLLASCQDQCHQAEKEMEEKKIAEGEHHGITADITNGNNHQESLLV